MMAVRLLNCGYLPYSKDNVLCSPTTVVIPQSYCLLHGWASAGRFLPLLSSLVSFPIPIQSNPNPEQVRTTERGRCGSCIDTKIDRDARKWSRHEICWKKMISGGRKGSSSTCSMETPALQSEKERPRQTTTSIPFVSEIFICNCSKKSEKSCPDLC